MTGDLELNKNFTAFTDSRSWKKTRIIVYFFCFLADFVVELDYCFSMSLYKEDVYESEDPPCEENIEVAEDFESAEVEKIHLDMGGARKRFGNCLLDSDSADFSDSVAARRLKRGYKASEIFEAEPAGCEDDETFEQKYERLSWEVKKLVAEAEERQNDHPAPNRNDIIALNELLKSVANNRRQSNGQAPPYSKPENERNQETDA